LTLFGAGVFLLHPAQTESVAYVASRSENLSAFTYYAAFAVFLWTLPNAISWLRAIGILVLFALASLTKEHTMSLPVILLLTDLWWNPGFAGAGISVEGIKRNWRLYAMILAGAALGAVGVIRTIRTADTVGFGLKDLTPLEYFYSQGRSIWEYVRLFVLPAGLNIDRDFPVSRGPLDHGALFGWIAIVAVTVAAWMYRRRFPLAAYGWLAFLIMLAPTSSIIPIRDLIAERRLYLPMFGLLLMICEFLRRTTLKTATLVPALSAILLVFAFLTYQRSQVWASSVTLWKDTVEKSPNKARPRFQYAFALYEEGQCEQASSQFEATSKLQPPTYDLAIDWALALDCANRPGDALLKLQQAAQLEPKAHVYSLMGMINAKQGRREEAMAALDQAQKLDPRFAMSYVYRGNVYEVSSQPDLAAAEYRKALEIDPNLDAARQALARVAR
jgi:tetratricopeptide (TPR) repeat protein